MPLGALVGQWRRERTLRKHLRGVKGDDGSNQRHNQAANHQRLFSGEVHATPACSERSGFAMGIFTIPADA